MYGTPASEATLAIFSAMMRACTSLSITQGPAIRKRGLPPPRRSEPREISLPVAMRNFEDSTEAGGVAKAGHAIASRNRVGKGNATRGNAKGTARRLFAHAADE